MTNRTLQRKAKELSKAQNIPYTKALELLKNADPSEGSIVDPFDAKGTTDPFDKSATDPFDRDKDLMDPFENNKSSSVVQQLSKAHQAHIPQRKIDPFAWDEPIKDVTLEQLLDWVRKPENSVNGRTVPVMVWAETGTGKTTRITKYCKDNNLEIVRYKEIDDEHLSNLPWHHVEASKQGIILIEDINTLSDRNIAELYEPLGDGTLSHAGWKMPKGWMIVATGKPLGADSKTKPLDEAMFDRMLHYALDWDVKEWSKWATEAVDTKIVDFVNQMEAPKGGFSVEVLNKLRATPRSLTYLSALYLKGMPPELLKAVSNGILGPRAGYDFRQSL